MGRVGGGIAVPILHFEIEVFVTVRVPAPLGVRVATCRATPSPVECGACSVNVVDARLACS